MPSQKVACFDQSVLRKFLNEKLEPASESQVQSHIASCEFCRSSLEQLAGNATVWTEIQDHLAAPVVENSSGDDIAKDQQRALRAVKGMLAPTDNPGMLGRIGPYEVCGVIGRGSSGIVVKAHDPRLNRYVAIKLLAPVYSNIGSSRRRFEREGRAVASLNNPHVIPIHAVQDFQGTPYIVMQYLPDGSLQQRIDRTGPLSSREVVCVGMQIADGLAAAHSAGIVHRDVKPANVLLESGVDSAMVTDFGLARVVDEATMTHSGSISGTPQYMSPEQARGESVDPRSDLFSLGSVMYTACTGHAPFRAKTVFGVIKKVCDNEPRAIRELNPDIADWLQAFIEKLNAKSPEDRFQSAAEVAELLKKELAHMQSPTMIPQPSREWWQRKRKVPVTFVSEKSGGKPAKLDVVKRRSAWKFIAGGVALLCIAGAGIFAMAQFSRSSDSKETAWSPNTAFRGYTIAKVSTQESDTAMLAITRMENNKLSSFDRNVKAEINVRPGGLLALRTNLGTIDVSTHDQNMVIMRLKHTVKSRDKKSADKIFKEVKLNYDVALVDDVTRTLKKGRDAAIIVNFPTERSLKEFNTANEELKNELLIKHNSHPSNAEFELIIPKKFNIDLKTSAGPISADDIAGTVRLKTLGGAIDIEDVFGDAHVDTHGGHIEAGNISGNASFETMGGNIDVLNVGGKFYANTSGGRILAGHISGSADAMTRGGQIELIEVDGTVLAESGGGNVTVLKAHEAVIAEAHAGEVMVNFIGQPKSNSKLTSHAGSIRVGYTDQVGFEIDAMSTNGYITGPFLSKKHMNSLKHQLNNGTASLYINSNSGPVKFRLVDKNNLESELKSSWSKNAGRKAFQKAYNTHISGDITGAIPLHKEAAKFESQRMLATYNLGCAYALKDRVDEAFEALNKAIDFGMEDIEQFETDSDLDSIRDDSRYEKLIHRMEKKHHKHEQSRAKTEEVINIVTEGRNLFQKKNYEEAESLFRTALEIESDNEDTVFLLGSTVHALGKLDEAEKLHKRLANSDDLILVGKGNYNLACIYALRDETDKAFTFLKKAINSGYLEVKHMKHDKDLMSIRSDERFDDLIEMAQEIIEEGTEDEACDSDCNSQCECEKENIEF